MNDIHDIKPLIDATYFSWKILLLSFGVIVLLFVLFWRQIKAQWIAWRASKNEVVVARPVKIRVDALKEARKKLKEAQRLLKEDKIEESLLTASHACKLYLEGTYHFNATGMTAEDIAYNTHLSKEEQKLFTKIFERLNFENFSSQDITREEAAQTFTLIEEQLK